MLGYHKPTTDSLCDFLQKSTVIAPRYKEKDWEEWKEANSMIMTYSTSGLQWVGRIKIGIFGMAAS